ncbi:MAG TPA: hypothetical protein VN704_06140 [Verrucomicrobiae bacterium]|nr:hypothetical protein [Verrucomicrobiae bacterium]
MSFSARVCKSSSACASGGILGGHTFERIPVMTCRAVRTSREVTK